MTRNGHPFLTPVLGLVLISVLLAGCGGGVERQANVDAGDYYTAEEFKKLDKEQRDAYCDDLAAAQRGFEESAADAEARASQAQGAIPGLESQLAGVNSELSSLEGEVRTLQAELDREKSKPRQYTVVSGDNLWNISGMEKIYADPIKWPRIYRANRDQIVDPNLIYPDWVLKIPRGWPAEHTVREGEYLSLISSYWEVYGSARQWPDLYKANKDQINDPDLIYPDQVLRIPR
jgi:nucleoid-associated protein YgaU